MFENTEGKAHSEPSAEAKVARVRAKPTLVTLGKKIVTSDGRFHVDLLADYTIERGRDRWIPVGEAASVCFFANTPRSKEKIRKRLSRLAAELKARGFLLIAEPGDDGKVKHFKVFTGSEIEKQYAETKLGYWQKRAERAEEWVGYTNSVIGDAT